MPRTSIDAAAIAAPRGDFVIWVGAVRHKRRSFGTNAETTDRRRRRAITAPSIANEANVAARVLDDASSPDCGISHPTHPPDDATPGSARPRISGELTCPTFPA